MEEADCEDAVLEEVVCDDAAWEEAALEVVAADAACEGVALEEAADGAEATFLEPDALPAVLAEEALLVAVCETTEEAEEAALPVSTTLFSPNRERMDCSTFLQALCTLITTV